MTFSKWGQRVLAATASAALGLGLISCGQSNTIDFVYLLSSKSPTGQIYVYDTDSITGALTQIKGSPYSTGGANPVGIVVAPSGQYAYVINQDSSTVTSFSIGGDGSPTAIGQSGVTTPGTEPVAIGINQAGTLLFVVDVYQPGFSSTNPGAGALVVYPISSSGALGSAVTQTLSASQTAAYYPVGNTPSALRVLNNATNPVNNVSGSGNYVYVTSQLTADAAGCTTGQGAVNGFSVSASGVLTPVNGSPFCAGVTPSSIYSHPVNSFLYVTDSAQNELIGYKINNDGSLTSFIGGPVGTGTYPDSVTVDQTGQYLYVANRFSNNVGSYSIAQGTGIPASSGTIPTSDPYPQCVLVDPALDRFVYTSDFEGIGISGFQLNPNSGVLTGTENAPYVGAGSQNTCLAATPHNNHPVVQVSGTAS